MTSQETSNEVSFVISDILQWIESDLSMSLSLDDIARKSGYSKRYFQYMFRKTTGYSVISYIRMKKLTAAATQLKSTREKITDIYLSVGYDDGSVFSRSFQRYFGLTPREYRKKSNKG